MDRPLAHIVSRSRPAAVGRGVAAALLEQIGLDRRVGTVRITHDQIDAGRDDFVYPLLELAVKMLDLDGAGDEDGDAFRCPGHVRRQAS